MQFFLNQNPTVIHHPLNDLESVNLTVLEWLRQQGPTDTKLTGTKEGCGSGDCGACTAIIGEIVTNRNESNNPSKNQSIQYRSINTCITLMGQLHGKQLITVEGLATPVETVETMPKLMTQSMTNSMAKSMNSLQQLMVENHASQCGFCTPGFVMSLYSMLLSQTAKQLKKLASNQQAQDELIGYYLSGNLCRCTGYLPILQAGRQALQQFDPANDCYLSNRQTFIKQLASIASIQPDKDTQKTNATGFHIPSSLTELDQTVQSLNHATKPFSIVAGGTDFGLTITQNLHQHNNILSLSQVTELNQINETEINNQPALEFSSAVTLETAKPYLLQHYPTISEYFERFASKPIRNQATLCGNIANASPIGDLPPWLLAMQSWLKLRHNGDTRLLPLEDFFIDYRKTQLNDGEIIQSIIIPKLKTDQHLFFNKTSKRYEDDISAVSLVIKSTWQQQQLIDIQIACGGMAAIPKRAKQSEQWLKEWIQNYYNQSTKQSTVTAPTTSLIAELKEVLSQDFAPITDMRATADYRLQITSNQLFKWLQQHLSNSTDSLDNPDNSDNRDNLIDPSIRTVSNTTFPTSVFHSEL